MKKPGHRERPIKRIGRRLTCHSILAQQVKGRLGREMNDCRAAGCFKPQIIPRPEFGHLGAASRNQSVQFRFFFSRPGECDWTRPSRRFGCGLIAGGAIRLGPIHKQRPGGRFEHRQGFEQHPSLQRGITGNAKWTPQLKRHPQRPRRSLNCLSAGAHGGVSRLVYPVAKSLCND